MKVLFVCSGNSDSFEVVPFIREQGESLRCLGVSVDYYPIKGKGLLGYLKAGLKLRQHLQDKRYDIIHAHYTFSGWAAIIGAGSTPVVLSLMGSDAYGEYVGVNKVLLKSRFYTFLTWLIQPFVKAIISKSSNIEKYVYLKKKSFVIPNGVNTNKFKPEVRKAKPNEDIRKQIKKILFLGSKRNIRKNFPLAHAAVGLLHRTDVELINPFPVTHGEIPGLLNSADVLVVPSLMEGSPNIVKEAMACNCPIVATDTGDIRWVIGQTKGCYISTFSEADFAEKINLALEFSTIRGRTDGRLRIQDLALDTESIAKEVINVYKKASGSFTNDKILSSDVPFELNSKVQPVNTMDLYVEPLNTDKQA